MSEQAGARFTAGVVEALRDAIRAAAGQEVFCLGRLDDEGHLAELSVAARGNETAVPAITAQVSGWDAVVHNHPSGILRPSDQDLLVAARLGNDGIGFYIVDNDVEHVYVVVEPVARRALRTLDADALVSLIQPGGKLAASMEGYETRVSQARMLVSVVECLNDDRVGAFEAGTGVGKSLAYLIPAMAWVGLNAERVIVSTGTINLQQQLVEHDIPLVRRLLESGVRAELVKGRQNYLCHARLDEALEEATFFDDNLDELNALKAWAASTPTGSRSELPFQPGEQTWSEVCSEADTCRGSACPSRGGCFFLRARRAAAAAQLLVVNHHLLFADLSLRLSGIGYDTAAVLPPAQRLILDEAHNIEAAATSYFSTSFSRASLGRAIRRLHRVRKGRAAGLIHRLPGMDVASLVAAIADLEERAEAANVQAAAAVANGGTYHLAGRDETAGRLVLTPLEDLGRTVSELAAMLEGALATADPEDTTAQECRAVVRRLRSAGDVAAAFQRFEEQPQTVFWLEATRSRGPDPTVRFTTSPLDVGPLMREAVYQPYPTVVFTSATLTVGSEFGFWSSRVGLDDDGSRRYVFGIHPSPFDYRKNVLLGVPKDLPAPTDAAYTAAASELIVRAVEMSEGGALILFTSRAALDDVYQRTRERISARGIPVMRQGDDDRFRLLARFRESGSSVLYATASFWEGIDAPGDALRLLIVCRLPFRVPTDPVVKARVASLEAEGRNAFAEYSLPDAVVRLRQGFGRLIRTATDRGVVLILDSRIVTKPYGATFLESLPETNLCITSSDGIVDNLERFYYARR
jgi:ATP-dependent DNA helicase DinG